MEAHPQRNPWQSSFSTACEALSHFKGGHNRPPFLPSPKPHPMFRENEFEEGKTRDRKTFSKPGWVARLGSPPHPPAHLSASPTSF